MTNQLDRDILEHARAKLGALARQHVREGMGPASAAYAAIRETQALFPHDWRFGVQGSDEEEAVEVWEVEHKYPQPIARIERAEVEEVAPRKPASRQRSGFSAGFHGQPQQAALTAAQQQHLAIIRDHGGSVRRSWLGGWLGGVRGLRMPVIEQLVRDGVLVTTEERATRRTTRSKGMPSIITTYKIVEGAT